MTGSSRADVLAARTEQRGIRETRQAPISGFELREVPNGTGGTNLRFAGYASITCRDESDLAHVYEMEDWLGAYTEGMVSGAFKKTLSQAADVTFLINHTGVTLARTKPGTLKLGEDTTGLHTEALLNPTRSDVQILRAAVEDGAIDEMSFAFRVLQQTWSYLEDNGVIDRRWIKEVDLNKGDVSAVNFGANDLTGGLVSIRNRVLGGPPEPTRVARGSLASMRSPVALPDHTTHAQLDLARYRAAHNGATGDAYDPLTEARRSLMAARRRAV